MNWSNYLLDNEILVRMISFLCIFGLMACWEIFSPCRPPSVSKALRWVNNLSLVVLNSLLLRLLFPAAAAGIAATAQAQGWGLFNLIALPTPVAVAIAIAALDFAIWLQHVMFHAVPLLWRLHRVHHADLDYDVTTGSRFHTLEILLSMLIKFATILLLGPPVIAVVIFEIVLNATAMFNHANVSLPPVLDRMLRWLLVTPDMHRVHHSIEDDEANSNFGFNLPWWDRLFGTYRDQPREGHQGMTIGIRNYREPRTVNRLPGMLAMPFMGAASGYAINRRRWSNSEEK